MHLHSRLDRSVGYLLFMRRSVCHRRAKPIYWTVSRRVLLGNSQERFCYTVLEPALRGSGGLIKGSAEEAVRRARPAPRPEPPLPLRAASGVLLDRLRLSG